MKVDATEKFLAKILGLAGAFTTIFLISGSVTDPVNAPKMVSIGVLGSAAFATLLSSRLRIVLAEHKVAIFLVVVFFFFMLISSFASESPLTQLLYGAYGRNNGLFTYLFLGLILLSATCLNSQESFRSLFTGFFLAGTINIFYCLWVIVFGDFISWNNPYKSPLGTLGNPNFIGAFLGMFFTVLISVILDKESRKALRYFALILTPICAFEIVQTHAIQGRVVAVAGASLVVFLFLRAKANPSVLIFYSAVTSIIGAFALAGAFQIGPLTPYIYKTSISLRGQYWLAGWNTGQSHPLTGVGMDSFGDWYRRMRDSHALELPGVNTVVNAAHNVPIDILAFGGWALFITYLFLMGLAGLSIVRVVLRRRNFDLIFTSFATIWVGYQLQSIISINQIGLAVWGWLLSGALIAYERVTRDNSTEKSDQTESSRKTKSLQGASVAPRVFLTATLAGSLGLLITLPPLTSDAKWLNASKVRTVAALEEALKPSYFNPPNSTKYLQSIQALEQSNLFDLSHKYALQATNWNPDCFEFWKVLYFLKNSTTEERAKAVANMKRLDPHNPDVTSA